MTSMMTMRSIVLRCLPILLVCLSGIPSVQAQTTTITSFQYPSQIALQNGVALATVTFTATYDGLPPGYVLGFVIVHRGTHVNDYASGSGTSAPDKCSPRSPTYATSAVCATFPSSSSGTETISFSLTFNSTGQYALQAFAIIEDPSAKVIEASRSIQDFTISVTAQTVPTTSTTTTQSSGPLGIPGFQLEAIILGLALGFALLPVMRHKSKAWNR
jgi:hypothetical protein